MSQKGQVVLILILVMAVALSIGLSVVQKSLVDISTASKVEQSSRAFSAAEAGIEKALRGDTSLQIFAENNSSITEISSGSQLGPPVAQSGIRQAALEYPSLAKEDVAQVWLSDFSSTSNPPAAAYTQNTLDVYWGNSSQDRAAIELTLVYRNGTVYQSRKWYLDQTNRDNGFDTVSCTGFSLGNNTYQCKKILGDSQGVNNGPLPSGLMLIRARLLYNETSQPFAVQAVETCGTACSLPPQSRSITSTGVSGETQRRIKVFQEIKVVPPYFNYAIFSAAEIEK